MENLEKDEEYSNFVQRLIEMGKKEPNIDESKLILNPFSQDLVIQATRRIDVKAKIKDQDGNMVPATSLLDKAKSTKVYISAANRNKAMELSAGALKMFVFIIHEMEPAKDYITVLPEWYKEKGGSTLNVYKKAIEELCVKGYLTQTIYKHTWWVNPTLFFSGSRLSKYPDKVVVTNEAKF